MRKRLPVRRLGLKLHQRRDHGGVRDHRSKALTAPSAPARPHSGYATRSAHQRATYGSNTGRVLTPDWDQLARSADPARSATETRAATRPTAMPLALQENRDARPAPMHLSEREHRSTRTSNIQLRDLGRFEVKGAATPVRIFELLGIEPRVTACSPGRQQSVATPPSRRRARSPRPRSSQRTPTSEKKRAARRGAPLWAARHVWPARERTSAPRWAASLHPGRLASVASNRRRGVAAFSHPDRAARMVTALTWLSQRTTSTSATRLALGCCFEARAQAGESSRVPCDRRDRRPAAESHGGEARSSSRSVAPAVREEQSGDAG